MPLVLAGDPRQPIDLDDDCDFSVKSAPKSCAVPPSIDKQVLKQQFYAFSSTPNPPQAQTALGYQGFGVGNVGQNSPQWHLGAAAGRENLSRADSAEKQNSPQWPSVATAEKQNLLKWQFGDSAEEKTLPFGQPDVSEEKHLPQLQFGTAIEKVIPFDTAAEKRSSPLQQEEVVPQKQAPLQQRFYAAAAKRWGHNSLGKTPGSTKSWSSTFQPTASPAKETSGENVSGWLTLQGDDAMSSSDKMLRAKDSWQQLVRDCLASGRQYEDSDFPPEARSLFGQEKGKAEVLPNDANATPQCGCGKPGKKSNVQKEGPNKGRPYWHCQDRRCKFFNWADREVRRNAQMHWRRFPEFVVVHDYGFRAEDLRQGGVGDCWFLSALAVVAERPDLILRLFGGETTKNPAGSYQLRFFLDGEWQTVSIDDQLPCTNNQRRPDGSGLAYSRADGQQLWTPLLEKAYAKAHGSYRAISGGEIAEALLDLTGFPTETIDFDAHDFDPQEVWERLVNFKEKGFPMGCATAGDPQLRQVGLCGNHAYSVLDVRELYDVRFMGKPIGYGGAAQDGVVRLLRIRNPHGVGEWNGDWSDKSSEWTESLAAELGCTGKDDGTFWIDYTHFLMAFQLVDVCMAYRGWHAKSFENCFCPKTSASRLCKYMYELRCDQATSIYAMALQPTKRGAWCRDDRKKSYKPGDISLLLIRLGEDRSLEEIVGGNFFCADIMARKCVQARLLKPGATYVLVALSLGTGPVAHGGEIRGSAPFRVRLFAEHPLAVRPVESDHHPRLAAEAVAAVHTACLTLVQAPGRRFRRQVRQLGQGVVLFQVTGEGTVILLLANTQDKTTTTESDVCATVNLKAEVKVMTARAADGLLTVSDKSPDKQPLTCIMCGQAGHLADDCPLKQKNKGIKPQWRWAAKWRRISTTCQLPPGAQRVALVLVGNGMQTQLGSIEAELEHSQGGAESAGKLIDHKHKLSNARWSLTSSLSLFEVRPLMKSLVEAASKSGAALNYRLARAEFPCDDAIDSIKQISLSLMQQQEEAQLRAALAASTSTIHVGGDDAELAEVLRLSSQTVPDSVSHQGQHSAFYNSERESNELAEVLRLSSQSYSFPVAVPGSDDVQLAEAIRLSTKAPPEQVGRGEDEDLAAALLASQADAAVSAEMHLKATLMLSTAPSMQGFRSVDSSEVQVLVDSDSDDCASQVQSSSPMAKRPKIEH